MYTFHDQNARRKEVRASFIRGPVMNDEETILEETILEETIFRPRSVTFGRIVLSDSLRQETQASTIGVMRRPRSRSRSALPLSSSGATRSLLISCCPTTAWLDNTLRLHQRKQASLSTTWAVAMAPTWTECRSSHASCTVETVFRSERTCFCSTMCWNTQNAHDQTALRWR